MSQKWPSAKARVVFRALLRIGWRPKTSSSGSSHVSLERPGWPDYTWAFHEGVEIGSKMMSRIAKHTGLKRSDV
ncbi:MAG: type II toxin-antitoxin system HicA family toxin [Myxococcaceae bacterium]